MFQLLGCKRLATPAPTPAAPCLAVALTPLWICFLIWAHAQSRSEREETTKGPSVPCGCRSGGCAQGRLGREGGSTTWHFRFSHKHSKAIFQNWNSFESSSNHACLRLHYSPSPVVSIAMHRQIRSFASDNAGPASVENCYEGWRPAAPSWSYSATYLRN